MPVRDIGDAAPTARQSTTLNLIVCSNVKAHGTMQASSPTTTLLAYHTFSTVSIMETAGWGHRALQVILIFITHFQICAYGGGVR